MAEGGESECDNFGKLARKQTKYGTTQSINRRSDSLIRYTVQPSDTLQAISVRWNVTVEEIKRINKLWSNEELCLKEYIFLPLRKDILSVTKDCDRSPAHNASTANGMVKSQSLTMSLSSQAQAKEETASSPDSKSFLAKFDSSLNQVKSRLKDLESQSSVSNDSHNPLNFLPKRRSVHYGQRQQAHHSIDSEIPMFVKDFSTEPELVIKTADNTSSPKPKKPSKESHEKWERFDDDFFEL